MDFVEHWFYVLYSLKDSKLYKGTCSNIGNRFLKHELGGALSTRHRRPFVLIYLKKFECKSDALKYESFTKTLEGGIALRNELKEANILNSLGKLNSPS